MKGRKKLSSVTPRVEVLLQKLIFPQLVRKFPELHVTRTFSTVSKTGRYRSQINPVHAAPIYIKWISILSLSSHLRLGLPSGSFPWDYPNKTLYALPLSPYTCHMPRRTYSSWFDHTNNPCWRVERVSLSNSQTRHFQVRYRVLHQLKERGSVIIYWQCERRSNDRHVS